MKPANRRLVLIMLVAAAAAPVTWIRHELPPLYLDAPVRFARLAVGQAMAGEVRLQGGWKLASSSNHFGGYSALIATDDHHLIAASDRGRIMHLALPGAGPPVARMRYLSAGVQPEKHLTDVESMTHDPATGRIWIGYEGVNAVERRNRNLADPRRVRPPQMRDWPVNKGVEAMARLDDGRFILIAEGSRGWFGQEFPALLFGSDPVDGGTAEEFRFDPPAGYRPVDMVQIPDGRVLILVRRVHWQIMPRFTARLVLADPATIAPGEKWSGRTIATFAPPIPSDNFEGLALWPLADGQLDLWIISDDNRNGFQSTVVLKMRWDPGPSNAPGPAQ